MKEVEIEAKLKLYENSGLFSYKQLLIIVKAKVPGHFFKIALREVVYEITKGGDEIKFLQNCSKFANDEQKIKSYAISMLEEYITMSDKQGKTEDSLKLLRRQINNKKIKFTANIKGLE